MIDKIMIFTDGGSRGNPGPAGGAYVFYDAVGNMVGGKGVFIPQATNNVAEYTGMYEGLAAAAGLNVKHIEVFSDSELIVKQIKGQYRVKSENLKELYTKCMNLLSGFEAWSVEHVRRDKNVEADKLANRAMDERHDVIKGSISMQAKDSGVKPLRLGVLISGGGTTMVNIQKEIDAGRLNAEIVVVISSLSTVRGIELAKGMGLPLEIVCRKDFADLESFSGRIEEVLDKACVDLVIQAGWLCLWRIPEQYDQRVMNIHPALLPAFGGQGMWGHHVHEAVLKKGCKISGCTVHFCNNQYDEGPIIIQRSCRVEEEDDASSLAERVFDQECIAYPEAIRLFAEGKLVVKNGTVKIMADM